MRVSVEEADVQELGQKDFLQVRFRVLGDFGIRV